MCAPAFPWDLFILDVAFVLTLLGGTLVLRARGSAPSTWVAFGVLSFTVGTFLFTATLTAQSAYGAAVAASSTLFAPCA